MIQVLAFGFTKYLASTYFEAHSKLEWKLEEYWEEYEDNTFIFLKNNF
jgi:hypothetical protein